MVALERARLLQIASPKMKDIYPLIYLWTDVYTES